MWGLQDALILFQDGGFQKLLKKLALQHIRTSTHGSDRMTRAWHSLLLQQQRDVAGEGADTHWYRAQEQTLVGVGQQVMHSAPVEQHSAQQQARKHCKHSSCQEEKDPCKVDLTCRSAHGQADYCGRLLTAHVLISM
jgi:hypothetical protein